ncbi:methylmalonyl Co-A mutase-associated GTPase MeaB [Planomonospora parontospora]|uniref:methylmalonyl Co-A mutase-associated GTPase MeaB n=1 Tax=Planomonospora parontospora TaxID=58119 RepID=UPI00166FEE8B|nr:methylmalonyl Co-A mutase-associated GTPase MeaB [Planomonospora parontospora]GGL35929.1 transporter [Planomonospora parontospora subsp. antibiotica]GII17423.1 transporter [Planomonospora parontospora subsp. antibiotica]
MDLDVLVEGVRQGRPRAVARLITLVENGSPLLREISAELVRLCAARPERARIIGLTGSPGVGKSTSTAMLVRTFRERGRKVGVLAVDPSSPFTGGALLGDRVRMQDHATDSGVFIRSMASRGHLGGLSWAAPQALRVLEAAGCEVILVETVGVGQAEVDIASLADSTIVLLAPGMGDGVQAAKAGILEIADVFVVNKADRDGAQATVRELRNMLALVERSWRPPIVPTVAYRGEGGEDVAGALDAHLAHLEESGELERRRRARARDEIEAVALAALRSRFAHLHGDRRLDALAARVLDAELDPYTAADELLASLG